MKSTFFFYDLETSGLNPREDRIMQFAGQRTDMELRPLGEPVNVLVKLTDDTLPHPNAISVTKITPQQTLADGISEPEFARMLIEKIFLPQTIAVGYNTVRFDDEFIRHLLWRNFHDPYEWQWKEGRSRWDLLDLVRMTRALRPEGINWPIDDDGKPTNRLDVLTKANHIEHLHAHDALSDVYASIAVAKLLLEKQPDLFKYLFSIRDKRKVKKIVNLDTKKPFVYTSRHLPPEFNKTTVAFPLTSARNSNILVFDLRYNLEEVLKNPPRPAQSVHHTKSIEDYATTSEEDDETPGFDLKTAKKLLFPVVEEFHYNKCPAVAPLGVLDKHDGWKKIGLDDAIIQTNLQILLAHPEFAEKMREIAENFQEFPTSPDPEAALYDAFIDGRDRTRCDAVKGATENQLADFHPDFDDERLSTLLLHFKGRNFPKALTLAEEKSWQSYRKARLKRQAPEFLEELKTLAKKDSFLAEELKLYFESLFDPDY